MCDMTHSHVSQDFAVGHFGSGSFVPRKCFEVCCSALPRAAVCCSALQCAYAAFKSSLSLARARALSLSLDLFLSRARSLSRSVFLSLSLSLSLCIVYIYKYSYIHMVSNVCCRVHVAVRLLQCVAYLAVQLTVCCSVHVALCVLQCVDIPSHRSQGSGQNVCFKSVCSSAYIAVC